MTTKPRMTSATPKCGTRMSSIIKNPATKANDASRMRREKWPGTMVRGARRAPPEPALHPIHRALHVPPLAGDEERELARAGFPEPGGLNPEQPDPAPGSREPPVHLRSGVVQVRGQIRGRGERPRPGERREVGEAHLEHDGPGRVPLLAQA